MQKPALYCIEFCLDNQLFMITYDPPPYPGS
jgi:hypothetical protein